MADDTSALLSFHDEAVILGEEFPGHRITVENGRHGLRFAATARRLDSPGPAALVTSSAEQVRKALGGKR